MANPDVNFFEGNFLRIRWGVQRRQNTVRVRIEEHLPKTKQNTAHDVARDELRLELLSRKYLPKIKQKTPEDINKDEFRLELLK
jgi:hypothetical protein